MICMIVQRTYCGQCSLCAEDWENSMTTAHKSDGKDGKGIHQMEHWSKVAPNILAVQAHLCSIAQNCHCGAITRRKDTSVQHDSFSQGMLLEHAGWQLFAR